MLSIKLVTRFGLGHYATRNADAAWHPRCVLPRLYGEFVWRFEPASVAALPYHRFKRGDTVVVAQQEGDSSNGNGAASSSGDGSSFSGARAQPPAERLEGTVLEVQREGLLVTVPKAAADALSVAGAGVSPVAGAAWWTGRSEPH